MNSGVSTYAPLDPTKSSEDNKQTQTIGPIPLPLRQWLAIVAPVRLFAFDETLTRWVSTLFVVACLQGIVVHLVENGEMGLARRQAKSLQTLEKYRAQFSPGEYSRIAESLSKVRRDSTVWAKVAINIVFSAIIAAVLLHGLMSVWSGNPHVPL